MTLQLVVDDIESVPEALREHYTRQGGKFRLNVDGFETLAAQWNDRIASLTAQRDAALASERAALTDASIDAALARFGATAIGRELLPSVLKPRIRLENDGPVRTVKILNADEKTAMKGTGKGGAATFADLMAEARNLYPSMFT